MAEKMYETNWSRSAKRPSRLSFLSSLVELTGPGLKGWKEAETSELREALSAKSKAWSLPLGWSSRKTSRSQMIRTRLNHLSLIFISGKDTAKAAAASVQNSQ